MYKLWNINPDSYSYSICKLDDHEFYAGKNVLRSTNPETPKDQLFISNCFELLSDWLSQLIRGQLKTVIGVGVPGFELLKLCYL